MVMNFFSHVETPEIQNLILSCVQHDLVTVHKAQYFFPCCASFSSFFMKEPEREGSAAGQTVALVRHYQCGAVMSCIDSIHTMVISQFKKTMICLQLALYELYEQFKVRTGYPVGLDLDVNSLYSVWLFSKNQKKIQRMASHASGYDTMRQFQV